MLDPEEHIIDRIGKRVFGAILGLVLGLVIGMVAAAVIVGSGNLALFIGVVVGVTLAGGAIGYLLPTPFLVLAEVLISIFT